MTASSKGLERLQRAWSEASLRPKIEREVRFVGDRVNRELRKQSLYRQTTSRGRLQATLQVSSGYLPTGIDMQADGLLVRGRNKPPHVINIRDKRRRPGPDLVYVNYLRRKGGGRKRTKGRKVVGALYRRSSLRASGRSLRDGPGADFLIAKTIAHSPALYQARIDRQLRKQTREMERRIGFLLRRNGFD